MKAWKRSDKTMPLWLTAGLIVLASRILLFALYWYWKNDVGSDDGFFRSLLQWDGGWYSAIAENGYGNESTVHFSGQAAWAFFPLVPFLEGVATRLSGLPVRVAGVLLNSVFFYLLTWWGARYITVLDGGRAQAIAFMLLINFGPYNVYYSTLYTEVGFGLLVCLVLYNLQRQHWLLMGVFGALAGATRNTGIFLVFAVPVWCILQYLREEDPLHKKSFLRLFRWVLNKPRLVLGTFLMPLGFFAYMHYLYFLLGDGLAFMHVQMAWGRKVGNPFEHLYLGLLNVGSGDFFQAVCSLLAIYLFLRQALRRRPEAIVTALFILIPLSTSVGCMARYTLCSFPVLLEASSALLKKDVLAKAVWAVFLVIFGIGTSLLWFDGAAIMM